MVTIIIPAYNVGKYIRQCLDSILMQTYKSLQVILIDDGSEDDTLEIIKQYEKKFNNFKLLCQKNEGVSVARNEAFKYIEGEYTIYIDSDDFLECNMIETMYNKAKTDNLDLVLCEYYYYYNQNDSRNFIEHYDINSKRIYNCHEVVDMILNFKVQGQLWNKLFRTELLKESKIYFEPGRYIQDIFPVFKTICKSRRIGFVKNSLYYYRQRRNSTVHKKNLKLAEDYYFAMNSIINYIKQYRLNIDNKTITIFRTKILSHFIVHYTNASNKNNIRTFKKSNYKSLNMKNKNFIFLEEISFREKLKLILWNFGMYNFIRQLKK